SLPSRSCRVDRSPSIIRRIRSRPTTIVPSPCDSRCSARVQSSPDSVIWATPQIAPLPLWSVRSIDLHMGRQSTIVQLWAFSVSFNGEILLANLLPSSRSTLSRGSFLSFLAFKEGMLSTPISVLGGWPTVSGRFLLVLRECSDTGQFDFFCLISRQVAVGSGAKRTSELGQRGGAAMPKWHILFT